MTRITDQNTPNKRMQSDPSAGDARTRVLNPWNGIFGWVGMCILILLSVLPMLSWNYQLLVQHRGLPRSMAFEEIEGDQRFIRGM